MTSGQYSFCLLLDADWLIQISEGLAVCKETAAFRTFSIKGLFNKGSVFSFSEVLPYQESSLGFVRLAFRPSPHSTILNAELRPAGFRQPQPQGLLGIQNGGRGPGGENRSVPSV